MVVVGERAWTRRRVFELTRDDRERRREDMLSIRQGQEDPDRANKIVVYQARKVFVLT